jgi:hypothetical protein
VDRITRPQYLRKGLRYASDVTEAEWNVIEPQLPAPAAGADMRAAHDELAYGMSLPLPSGAGFLSNGPESYAGRIASIPEPQLSVRSAKARDLARQEHRSIADVVERALEAYEIREAGREPASVFYARLANDYGFYARLANDYGSDLDLEVVIRENRKTNPGPEL